MTRYKNGNVTRRGMYGRVLVIDKAKKTVISGWVNAKLAEAVREKIHQMNKAPYYVTVGDFMESALRNELARLEKGQPASDPNAVRVPHPELNLGQSADLAELFRDEK